MTFINAFKLTAFQIFVLLGPGLLLALLMNWVAGRVEKSAYQLMGKNKYLWIFGWLGTMVHELGHALMCLLFGHKIHKLVLFNPDPNSHSLGYVEHSHNPRNIYHVIGNFFIGIGPILLGTAVIFLSALFLLSESFLHYSQDLKVDYEILLSLQNLKEFGVDVYIMFLNFLSDTFTVEAFKDWKVYAFSYLLFSVGSSMKLSLSDIKSALKGFTVIIGLLFLVNVALLILEIDNTMSDNVSIAAYLSAFYTAMLFSLLLNTILALLLSTTATVVNLVK